MGVGWLSRWLDRRPPQPHHVVKHILDWIIPLAAVAGLSALAKTSPSLRPEQGLTDDYTKTASIAKP